MGGDLIGGYLCDDIQFGETEWPDEGEEVQSAKMAVQTFETYLRRERAGEEKARKEDEGRMGGLA